MNWQHAAHSSQPYWRFHPLPASLVTKVMLVLIGSVGFAFDTGKASEPEKLSDETIRSLIPGSWVSREVLDGRPMTLAVEYRSNGTLGASAQFREGRYRLNLVLTGTWRVHNGILTTHTEATGSPKRTTSREVIAVTQTTLILRDQDGQIVVQRRAAEK